MSQNVLRTILEVQDSEVSIMLTSPAIHNRWETYLNMFPSLLKRRTAML
jgi:hypothetical protein